MVGVMGAAGSIETVEKVGLGDKDMKDISNLEEAKEEVLRLRALLAEQAEIISTDNVLMDELRAAVDKELKAEKQKQAEAEAAGGAGTAGAGGDADASKADKAKDTKKKKKKKAKKGGKGKQKKTKNKEAKKAAGKADGGANAGAAAAQAEEQAAETDIFAAKPADASDSEHGGMGVECRGGTGVLARTHPPLPFASCARLSRPKLTHKSTVTTFVQAKKEVIALRRVARLAYATLRSRVSAVLLTELPQALAKAKAGGKTPLIIDSTANKGVDSFYKYQSAQIVDAKGMAGRFFQKAATVEE